MTPSVPRSLNGKLVTPDDSRYPAMRSAYAAVTSPAMVILPESADEVADALRYARELSRPIKVRSGGHDLAGRSSGDNGVVIDLSRLDEVRILDQGTRLVRIGAGARWSRVARTLAPVGLAISSGDHGDVGVGGLATAGGIGWLARSYGMTIDHLRAAEVVLADGRIVRADADHEPDLFWALRGAGAGCGIVTAFEVEATELHDVGVVRMRVLADRDGETIVRLAGYMATAPRELTAMGVLTPYGEDALLTATAVYVGPGDRQMREAFAPLRRLTSGLVEQHIQRLPYPALLQSEQLHPHDGRRPAVTTNGLLRAMSPDAAAAITSAVTAPIPTSVQLRSTGGAMADLAQDATAYPHRDHQVLVIGTVFPPQDGAELDSNWRKVAPHFDGAYSALESRPDKAAFQRFYPGATGDRVRELWRRYDPDGVFGPQF